ncbi:hypothetical protein CBR_g52068 [Chara braunii]|uniref:Uncharacterized protein n=1 Tax=Chara braunii TaxID=69332 RepID=A0A388M9F0_CHABU|nr:hypothetical protein CBR_g52068 [Chara braunii]|eukprot:GBG91186.1 hypothetical protein CBR_g52068 [Chara braunii]
MSGGSQDDGGGLLPAPTTSTSSQLAGNSGVSNALVPYQAPSSRSANDGANSYDGYANYGSNSGYQGNQGYGGQRFSKPWGGGYKDRDRDDRFDKIYGLRSERAEEWERKKQEAAKLELLEAEKRRLQAEEEKNVQARKEKELHEARLGKIIHELEGVRAALRDRNNELSNLKSENSTLKKDFLDLKDEIVELKNANNKQASETVTEKSPPAEPNTGKQRMVPIGDVVCTPKDLDALHKAYKKAEAGEEIANKELQALKERMTHMGAQLLTKQRQSVRRSSGRKTTPRNLRPALSAVQIEPDDSGNEEDPMKTKNVEEGLEKPEEVQLKKLQEEERRSLSTTRKADMLSLARKKGSPTTNWIKPRPMWERSVPREDLHNGSRIKVSRMTMTMIETYSTLPLRKMSTTSENAP